MTGLYAHKLPPRCTLRPDEEADADAALLSLFRLRDRLYARRALNAAQHIDMLMTGVEDFARGRVDQ